jgi:hypothetical protein
MIFFLNSKLGAPEIREPRKEERRAAAKLSLLVFMVAVSKLGHHHRRQKVGHLRHLLQKRL